MFASDVDEILEEDCRQTIRRDISISADDILTKLCPYGCRGNGQCNEGKDFRSTSSKFSLVTVIGQFCSEIYRLVRKNEATHVVLIEGLPKVKQRGKCVILYGVTSFQIYRESTTC